MLSQPVEVVSGLRQGDAIFPILFNLVLEKIVRETNLCEGVELGRSTINILAYADDIALLERSREMIIKMGKSLIKAAEKVGLRINEEKTEYMVVSRRNGNLVQEEFIEVEEYKFRRIDQFKYLGSIITQDNDIKTEISMRLQSANKCFFGLSNIFRSRAISKNLKVRMYLTLLRPIVLYGAETWPLRKTEELIDTGRHQFDDNVDEECNLLSWPPTYYRIPNDPYYLTSIIIDYYHFGVHC
jgi:hypothetical protein